MPTPPLAPVQPRTRQLHGRTSVDDYAWMASDHQRLREYLAQELDHYVAATAGLEPVRRRLFTEMVARTPPSQEGPEHVHAGAAFRDAIAEGAQLGRFQRRDPDSGQWSTLLDLDEEAAARGSSFAEVGVRTVSPDGRQLAWSLDATGAELHELRFRDIRTGRDGAERIAGTSCSGAWAADSRTFFYTVLDDVFRAHQVWRHRIGTDPAEDTLVLQEDDRRFEVSVRASRCGRWVLVHAASRDSAETWAIPADQPTTAPTTVGGRREGHEYEVESVPSGPQPFLAVTNHGTHREFTLCWLGLGDTDPQSWQPAVEAVPLEEGGHGAGGAGTGRSVRRYTSLDSFAGHVVVSLREAGRTDLCLVPVTGQGLAWDRSITHRPDAGHFLELGTNEDYTADVVTVVTQSRVDPPVSWDIPFAPDGQAVVRHRAQAPNHDPQSYVVRTTTVPARDGQPIPVTLVAHRVTPLDGTAPCLLYGYGAYEHVVEPRFSRVLPSLLDRGVVHAHAHVRGGGELGRGWWDAGHLATKTNSFRDFVDVAHGLGSGSAALVDGSRIVARGGSAGGLLVAASMDLDPQAFTAVIAEVPFVDVLTTMLDPELPLTVGEWEEWGNPALAEQYGWISAYSPYDNVPPAGRRPFLLATGAVNDPRVLVHEPAKWVARLRATDPEHGAVEQVGQRGGVLLRVSLGEGSHGGAAGRYRALDEEAQTQAVVLAAMGLHA